MMKRPASPAAAIQAAYHLTEAARAELAEKFVSALTTPAQRVQLNTHISALDSLLEDLRRLFSFGCAVTRDDIAEVLEWCAAIARAPRAAHTTTFVSVADLLRAGRELCDELEATPPTPSE